MRITPISRGNSGQRSRTSKTNRLPLSQRAAIPGMPAVSGVLVANSRSWGSVSAIRTLRQAKLKNVSARRTKLSTFE